MSYIDTVTASHVISKASRVVTLWSPWWINYLNKIDFIYREENPSGITGLSSMIFIVGKDFLQNNDVMDIAIRLEFALQQSVRDMDNRAHEMTIRNPYVDTSLIGLSQALEINSDMKEKFSIFTQSDWNILVSRNIDKSHVDTLDVRKPPRLKEDSWTSDDFGFPPNLRAEKYLDLLIEKDNQKQQEWLDAQDELEDNKEEQSEENNSDDKDNSSEQTPDIHSECNNSADIPENNEDLLSNNQENGDMQDKSHDDMLSELSNYTEVLENSNDNNDVDSEHGDDGKQDNNKIDDSNNDSQEISDNDSKQDSLEDNSLNDVDYEAKSDDLTQGAVSDFKALENDNHINIQELDKSPSEGHTEGKNSDYNGNGQDEESDSLLDDIDDIEIDNSNSMSTSDYQSFTDSIKQESKNSARQELHIPEKPKDQDISGKTPEEKEDINKQLAEDIQEMGDLQIPSGKSPVTAHFEEWSKKKLRKPRANWKKLLPKMMNPIMSRGQLGGQSDMSYAKRNPNQIEGAPLLMGFISYPPEVTILVDASPSMMKYKDTTMSELMGVLKGMFLAYAQPVTIALADSGIKYALSSMTPYKFAMNRMSRTYYGTSAEFGDTIERILKKGVKYGNSTFPKPDILIIFTDGLFDWPFPDKSAIPSKYAEIVIISTKSYDELQPILPKWVREGKNFVSTV